MWEFIKGAVTVLTCGALVGTLLREFAGVDLECAPVVGAALFGLVALAASVD